MDSRAELVEELRARAMGARTDRYEALADCLERAAAALADTGTLTDEMIEAFVQAAFEGRAHLGSQEYAFGLRDGLKMSRGYRTPNVPTEEQIAAVLCCGDGCAARVVALFGQREDAGADSDGRCKTCGDSYHREMPCREPLCRCAHTNPNAKETDR